MVTDILAVSNILLWFALAGMALVMLALLRQIGILHERIAPLGAMTLASGAAVGDPAPAFAEPGLTGAPVKIGGPSPGRQHLLLFIAPTCPVCRQISTYLPSFAQAERGAVSLILVGEGDAESHRRYAAEAGLDTFPYVVSASIGLAYRVPKLPYAVAIDAEGKIASAGLVNSREHLESLLVSMETGVPSLQAWIARQHKPRQAKTQETLP